MSYRAIDTNILNTVDVNNDTFQVFVEKMNLIVDHLRNTVVTVSNTSAYQGNNSGNGYVTGIFGGTTLVVGTALRGGNVTVSNTLNVTSDIVSNSSITVNGSTFTVNTGHSNVNTLNVRGLLSVGNSMTVSGNTTIVGSANVAGDLNVVGLLGLANDVIIDVFSNTNLGATLTAQAFFSFPKATYSSAHLTVQTKNGVNVHAYSATIAHDGTTPLMAVYGVVAAPALANNGLLSVGSNTTHIILFYQQTAANTSLKTTIQMVK